MCVQSQQSALRGRYLIGPICEVRGGIVPHKIPNPMMMRWWKIYLLWWSVCVCFQSFCLLPQSDYIHMKRIDDDVDGCLCGKSAKNACYELIEFPQTIGQQESTEREKLQYFSYSSILFIPVTHLTIHDIHFYETFLSLIWQKGSLGVFKTLRNSSPRKRKKQN